MVPPCRSPLCSMRSPARTSEFAGSRVPDHAMFVGHFGSMAGDTRVFGAAALRGAIVAPIAGTMPGPALVGGRREQAAPREALGSPSGRAEALILIAGEAGSATAALPGAGGCDAATLGTCTGER